MSGLNTIFVYYVRRAQQERDAADNARTPAAANIHRKLASLHAARALQAMVDQ